MDGRRHGIVGRVRILEQDLNPGFDIYWSCELESFLFKDTVSSLFLFEDFLICIQNFA